mmetsp:Transcript_12350/g.26697  ORF Transcript_12350/g.26697 Transcript_12350/m.26697 type:complete len:256 (+) Transcript_12350:335-1102(+)
MRGGPVGLGRVLGPGRVGKGKNPGCFGTATEVGGGGNRLGGAGVGGVEPGGGGGGAKGGCGILAVAGGGGALADDGLVVVVAVVIDVATLVVVAVFVAGDVTIARSSSAPVPAPPFLVVGSWTDSAAAVRSSIPPGTPTETVDVGEVLLAIAAAVAMASAAGVSAFDPVFEGEGEGLFSVGMGRGSRLRYNGRDLAFGRGGCRTELLGATPPLFLTTTGGPLFFPAVSSVDVVFPSSDAATSKVSNRGIPPAQKL